MMAILIKKKLGIERKLIGLNNPPLRFMAEIIMCIKLVC